MKRSMARESGRGGGTECCYAAADHFRDGDAQGLALRFAACHEVSCAVDRDVSVFEEGVTTKRARQHRGRGEVEALGFAQRGSWCDVCRDEEPRRE
jgi:hypothetical protein